MSISKGRYKQSNLNCHSLLFFVLVSVTTVQLLRKGKPQLKLTLVPVSFSREREKECGAIYRRHFRSIELSIKRDSSSFSHSFFAHLSALIVCVRLIRASLERDFVFVSEYLWQRVQLV